MTTTTITATGITIMGMMSMSTSTTADHRGMDADAFIAWAMEQPEGEHYELHDGMVVRMPNEASLHGLTKAIICHRVMGAIEEADLALDVYVDAMAVQITANTVFEPDIVVRAGERLPGNAVKMTDPLIAIEVLSPSSRAQDFGRKQEGYLNVPSLQHYLFVNPESRKITHYRRQPDGSFAARIHGDGPLTLDPPGITIDRLFP
jgi:Uma2 family endonuclease